MITSSTQKNKGLIANIVIIGGGGAGLSAAVAAAEKGASDIIVLEKMNAIGGNATMAGHIFAADSPVQQRELVDAPSGELFNILLNWAHWKIDPKIARAFIFRSGKTIDWLERKGIVFDLSPFYPNQVPYVGHAPRGRGLEVVRTLYNCCQEYGVRVFLKTDAKRIISGDKNGLYEVWAETENRNIRIQTKCIIIATGGYGGNRALIKKYNPLFNDTMTCIGLFNMGDGLRMAVDIGAAIEDLGILQTEGPCTPRSVRIPINTSNGKNVAIPLVNIAIEPMTLWVNKKGERFVDEALGFDPFLASHAVIRQPDAVCYSLLDSNLVRLFSEKGLLLGRLAPNEQVRVSIRSSLPGLKNALEAQAQKGTMTIPTLDAETCTGCGVCVNSCPLQIIDLDTLVLDKSESSSCTLACPAEVDMRRCLYFLKNGLIEEAKSILRESLPLPAVTGRVCPHPCEERCARKEVDEAININALERFVADYILNERPQNLEITSDARTAIVGSGPAGLSCAYFLRKMGYPVTVFEAMPVLGGMLRTGIPEYRLPKDILDLQINYIRDMGVDFKTGITVGKDVMLKDLNKTYPTIFLAIGNQLSRHIELEGIESEGIFWGLDFLRKVNRKQSNEIKGRVVVIGGGNVAVDVALTALRLGAKEVNMFCLEFGEQIPAFKEELKQALDEGVIIHEGWGPKKIVREGRKVSGIEFIQCRSVFDESGKFVPSFDERHLNKQEADTIVIAVGQTPDLSLFSKTLKPIENNKFQVDPVTLETNLPGIFLGGDIVEGISTVVEAIASGKRAAISIDRFHKKEDLREGRDAKHIEVKNKPGKGITKYERHPTPYISVNNRLRNFREVKLGFDKNSADQEAKRCMTCGSRAVINYNDNCRVCLVCETDCPSNAIHGSPDKIIPSLVKISDSIEELSEWMGINYGILLNSINEYNNDCQRGFDSKFNKNRKYLIPFQTPPFYAIKCHLDYLGTIGGIKINESMEVIDKHGQSIKGLFAAGIDTGGWSGDTYSSQLTGMTFGFAINSGCIAGENAAYFVMNRNQE